MKHIIKAELWKLKRYHMVWAGILLMLLSVVLTLFSSTANDGSVWTFPFLVEQVIKNNATTIFPMCITLIAGSVISREERDDTLKSITVIPVSYRRLLAGKLILCACISILFGLSSAVFTLAGEALTRFPGLCTGAVIQMFIQITVNCLFLYIAVLPVIAVSAAVTVGHMAGVIIAFAYGYGGMFAAGSRALVNIYPITASLGMVAYRSYEAEWNFPLCLASMGAMLCLTVIIVFSIGRNADKKRAAKQKQPFTPKKGW